MFLVDALRKEGKLPPLGALASNLTSTSVDPTITLSNGMTVPQLAYGLYKVPADKDGEEAVRQAVAAGYRHFDGASFYGNEVQLGNALRSTGLPRQEFFLTGKVWNDAVRQGAAGVRASVEKSLEDINFGGYFDLFLVHWPVPGHFVEAYKELEVLHKEGKLRAIGLSNFNEAEYEELVASQISIPPVVNQMEVSPVMYRPELIRFFTERGITIAAFKPLNRAGSMDRSELVQVATRHSVTPAQVMLRWALQKDLIVISKTVTPARMHENRNLFAFALKQDDMALLDAMTTAEDIRVRQEHEIKRKTGL